MHPMAPLAAALLTAFVIPVMEEELVQVLFFHLRRQLRLVPVSVERGQIVDDI